jgi:hypothetical protein
MTVSYDEVQKIVNMYDNIIAANEKYQFPKKLEQRISRQAWNFDQWYTNYFDAWQKADYDIWHKRAKTLAIQVMKLVQQGVKTKEQPVDPVVVKPGEEIPIYGRIPKEYIWLAGGLLGLVALTKLNV